MWDPAFVTSTSPTAAIREYLRQIYSKDAVFREHVQDLRTSDAFVGGLRVQHGRRNNCVV
jgi:hypothetical protein